MPINATPQYQKLEIKYAEARTTAEKIKILEEMLREVPSHKGAENLRKELRTRLAKLKETAEKAQKSSGSRQPTFTLRKEGAATIAIVGKPNSGKSTLLTQLTNAKPKVAEYPYTTTELELGIFEHEGVQLQLVEIPAITKNMIDKENGPAIMSVVRTVDLIILLINTQQDKHELIEELKTAGIITDKPRPHVTLKKTPAGGIEIVGTIRNGSREEVISILKNHNVYNGILTITGSATPEDIEEAVNERVKFLPAITLHNTYTNYHPETIGTQILEKLSIIRVYTKQPGKDKEYPPIALKEGTSIQELGQKIHKDFIKKFRFARVWGTSAKHQGMKTGLEHVLEDQDIVEFHIS